MSVNTVNEVEEFENCEMLVTVVVPCFNEGNNLRKCLDSIIENDYNKTKMEVLVIDGLSSDSSIEIIKEYCAKYNFIRLLINERRYTPYAFNIGIKNATGDVVIIMGAHSTYANDYISKCVYHLYKYNVDNVGGIEKILPRENTLIGNAIAIVMSHPFGVGNAEYRLSYDDAEINQKPRLVDTVFGGCYRKSIFDRIGLFNEQLKNSQDMELNIRLRKNGGKILLVPSIVTVYYARSGYIDFVKWTINNGVSAITPIEYSKTPLSVRHVVPLLFFIGIITLSPLTIINSFFAILFLLLVVIYTITTLYSSARITKQKKDLRLMVIMPMMFFTIHFFYGLGSFKGLFKLLFKQMKKVKRT